MRLSNFIEYSLYDSQKDKVTLVNELVYIQDYLELKKLRVGKKLDVSINVFDPVDDVLVPPMLLLPLVENCFKHGVNKSIGASWIRIDVSIKKQSLVLKIENSIEEAGDECQSQSRGLGLQNVGRRLELLYPKAHEFETFRGSNSFLVTLRLKKT